jgi:hypothetical protein
MSSIQTPYLLRVLSDCVWLQVKFKGVANMHRSDNEIIKKHLFLHVIGSHEVPRFFPLPFRSPKEASAGAKAGKRGAPPGYIILGRKYGR